MARMAGGHADDLASTVLLATDAADPDRAGHERAHVAAPGDAAQPRDAAGGRRRASSARTRARWPRPRPGPGRMAEPLEIVGGGRDASDAASGPRIGRRSPDSAVLVTSGPTHEPIDPVRYIANRSSGRQGHAIARAAAEAGARVTLVSGPVAIPDPPASNTVQVESAREMLAAVEAALPADIAVFAAAVADWRAAEAAPQKIKKDGAGAAGARAHGKPGHPRDHRSPRAWSPAAGGGLRGRDRSRRGPRAAKLATKGCDLIVANDVSPETGVMGGRSKHRPSRHARRASRLGRRSTRTRWRAGLSAHLGKLLRARRA